MDKPSKIFELEEYYGISLSESPYTFEKNTYKLNENKKIVNLNLNNNQISDISILEKLTTLKTLNLSNNQISDISILEKLTTLTTLNLSNNQISDISILEKLTTLTTLNLINNQISDISILEKLTTLTTLNLSNNQISDISILEKLTTLTSLYLSNNQISDISILEKLTSLRALSLSGNQVSDISILRNLKGLTTLDISSNLISDISPLANLLLLNSLISYRNQIVDISALEKLVLLTSLKLWSNQIVDISALEKLILLTSLDLWSNKVSDISILKKLSVLSFLDLSNNEILDISTLINLKGLTSLSIGRNKISDISTLGNLNLLATLDLSSNKISDISILGNLELLDTLDLSGNEISDISILGNLKLLTVLYLNSSKILDFSILGNLLSLKKLSLKVNKIFDVLFLKNLASLVEINLSHNQISDISVLKDLVSLTKLYLNDNKINDIYILKDLKSLAVLDLSDNEILDIEQFDFINDLPKFNIKVSNNPCFENYDIIIEKDKNNYDTISHTLKKIKETKQVYILPAKVLLLGNSGSGKSTLLDYLLQNKEPRLIKKDLGSTHIVQIETFPKRIRKNSIPQAVFYDFGGQDYYHGLYKAFLSNNSLNVLLWNCEYDKNQIRKDETNQLTRDYDRNYWLHQLKFQYTYNEKNNFKLKTETEPVLLVQTQADKMSHYRETYKGDCEVFNIKNEFYISLNQEARDKSRTLDIGLHYFEETLKEQIKQKQITKNEPVWYKDFLNHILRANKKTFTPLSELANVYNRQSDRNNLLLPEVLREIAQTGLILYYKDDADLKDIVWLNPSNTIQYIHNSILSRKNIIEKKGIVGKDDFEKLAEPKLTKLLLNQKVIFFDEFDSKYIIPGYLPLTEEDGKIYELLTFDFIDPNFIIKFEYFIPFGLINQLICFYGKNKNKKYYWRDQLLFTEDDSKILIKLDFTNLEIIVSIKSKGDTKKLDKLEQKIFKDILDLYWDKKNEEEAIQERLKVEEINIENLIDGKLKATVSHDYVNPQFNSPDDLYISIDNRNFVCHKDLEDKEKTFNKIMSFGLELTNEIQNGKKIEIRKLNKNLVTERASGLFKNFSNNKNTQNMKKIFISYSRKDVDYKNELKKHLNILTTFDISDNWSCEEIKIGKWETQIQQELNDSDLIIYMLSANFFSSKYILENEVKKGIDLVNENKGKNILCVIVSEFPGLDRLKNVLENRSKTNLQDSLLNLSSYQYLPYDTVFNTVNKNNEEKIISLKEHSNRNTLEKALTQITEKILDVVQINV